MRPIAAAFLALSALVACDAVHATDPPVELDPIEVTPGPDLLGESHRKLRRLMRDAPDGGSAVKFREDWTETVGRMFVPPQATAEERAEGRIAEDWRISERGPEMDAFR
ncbi:MAG TPA: hypothetical protein VM240_11845 [Verrucomicrobiae bacterium]|nr:hypothetical protein [Verrucomicrobiae bacterium]